MPALENIEHHFDNLADGTEAAHVIVDTLPSSGGGLTNTELRAADVKVSLDSETVALAAATAGAIGATSDAAVVTDANGSMPSFLRGLVKMFAAVLPASFGQKAMTASFPVVLASDQAVEGHIGEIGGRCNSVADAFARPADVTAYTAKDVVGMKIVVTVMSYTLKVVTLTAVNTLAVGDRITVSGVNTGFTVTNIDGNWICEAGTDGTHVVFTVASQPVGTTPQTITVGNVARLGRLANIFRVVNGSGYVTKVRLFTDLKTAVPQLRVHFYGSQIGAILDNGPFLLLWANRIARQGYVDLPALTSEDSANSDCARTILVPGSSNMPLEVHNSEAATAVITGKDLYYQIEDMTGVTPASAQNYWIEATVDTN
jgi:hypothetical protein